MDKWTATVPTPEITVIGDSKRYWFFGWAFGKLDPSYLENELPSLIMVDVIKTNRQYTYIADGNFMYPNQLLGIFKEYKAIDTPTVDELMEMIKPQRVENQNL